MKMQVVRWLLVMVSLAFAASAAWAGPGGTTTTTTTTVPGPTTTTTTAPTTTTTTGVPTTTTPTTTTPTTTTTTAAPTTTTTTTLAPGDLSGARGFFDRQNAGHNTALLNVSVGGNQFCVAGQFNAVDPTTIQNRRVIFEYQSNGTVRKSSSKAVDGEFVAGDLTLVIEQLSAPIVELYRGTLPGVCSVKASLLERGDASKAQVRCRVGDDFSDFPGIDGEPGGNDDTPLLTTINTAYTLTPRKNVKVNVKKGLVKIKHRGEPVPEGDTLTLTCPLGAP